MTIDFFCLVAEAKYSLLLLSIGLFELPYIWRLGFLKHFILKFLEYILIFIHRFRLFGSIRHIKFTSVLNKGVKE